MNEQVIYCNNAMLNLPGFNSTAAISVNIRLGDQNFGDDKEHKPSTSGGICISDCNRVIELDFYANDKEALANNIHKLRVLHNFMSEALTNLQAIEQEFNEKWDRVDVRERQERLSRKLNKTTK